MHRLQQFRRARFAILAAGLLAALGLGAATRSGASPRLDDAHERQVMIALGEATYQQFCAPCHGRDGRGKGVVSSLLVADPLDLTSLTRTHDGRFPVEHLEKGLRAEAPDAIAGHRHDQMPTWIRLFLSLDGSAALAHARLANLIAYLESIQR